MPDTLTISHPLVFHTLYTGQPHQGAGHEERRMSDGFIEVRLDGQLIEPGYPVTVPLNTLVPFSVTTKKNFKGIMARISGGFANVNTRHVFVIADDDLNLQSNQKCDLDVSIHSTVWLVCVSCRCWEPTTIFPSWTSDE